MKKRSTWGDPDNDGLKNRSEYLRRLDPRASDSDLNGLPDRAEVRRSKRHSRKLDRDRDRLPDRWERKHGLSVKMKSHRRDADGDGLSNRWEYIWSLDPRAQDSDGDGHSDADQVQLAKATASAKKKRVLRLISPPAIVGLAQEGETLVAEPGKWVGADPIIYIYQWQRCAAAGTGCGDVAGATGQVYGLTAADVGHAVRVVVTAQNRDDVQTAPSSPTAAVTAAPVSGDTPTTEATEPDGSTSDPVTTDPVATEPVSEPTSEPTDPVSEPTSEPQPAPTGSSCQAGSGDPVRYISPSGSDTADGLTAETAWATMQQAVENAPAGATVYLLDGLYSGFAWKTYTGRTGYVTFRPAPGASPRVAGFYTPTSSTRTDWVAFDCLTSTGDLGLKVRGTHVQFTNMRSPSGTISIEDGSSDVLISGNYVGGGDPLPYTCIGLWSSYTEPKITDVTIRGNRCEGMQYIGMNLRNFERVLVEDNLVAGITRPGTNHADAIRTYNGGSDLVVRRNLIRDNVAIGFFIKDGKVSNLEFVNNVIGPMAGSFNGFQIYDVDGALIANNTVDDNAVFLGQVTGATMFNNIFSTLDVQNGGAVGFTCNKNNLVGKVGNVSPGENGLVATPLYVAGDVGDDWRLQAESPGVNAGAAACGSIAAPETDLAATPRPAGGAVDMGAYEQ